MPGCPNLLIVAYDMIPYTLYWGGCQRMYFLAESLIDAGWNVTVVHSRKSLVGDFGKPVRFRAVPVPFGNSLLQSVVDKRSELKPSLPASRPGPGRMLAGLADRMIRNTDHFLYNEPNPGMGFLSRAWASRALPAVLDCLAAANNPPVLISGPPFGVFSLAPLIKERLPDARIVLEYRDPWNLWNDRKGWTALREAKALAAADRVVVTNEPSRTSLSHKFHYPEERISVIANGYSAADWSAVTAARNGNRKLVISYVGSINFGGYRDPDVLFQALGRFPGREDILLRFIGVSPSDRTRELEKRLPGIVEFQPKVPHRDSLARMMESDILLQVHTTDDQSSRYLVSAKVYDYIRSGRPVWSVGGLSSLSSRLVGDNGFGIVSGNTVPEIASALERLHALWKENRLDTLRTNRSDPSVYSREFQNARYADLLMSL